jgi:hypothetical protein
MNGIIFVALDVHKATVAVSVAEGVRGREVLLLGTIPNRADHIVKPAAKLGKNGRRVSFGNEAGPCGYGLHRQLTSLGHDCVAAAPSLIPMRAGDRVKTERRDAMMLAKLHLAGELTAVWVPDSAHGAIRDLVRSRRGRAGARQGASASARLPAATWPCLGRQEGSDPCLPALADHGALRPFRPTGRIAGLDPRRHQRRGASGPVERSRHYAAPNERRSHARHGRPRSARTSDALRPRPAGIPARGNNGARVPVRARLPRALSGARRRRQVVRRSCLGPRRRHDRSAHQPAGTDVLLSISSITGQKSDRRRQRRKCSLGGASCPGWKPCVFCSGLCESAASASFSNAVIRQ